MYMPMFTLQARYSSLCWELTELFQAAAKENYQLQMFFKAASCLASSGNEEKLSIFHDKKKKHEEPLEVLRFPLDRALVHAHMLRLILKGNAELDNNGEAYAAAERAIASLKRGGAEIKDSRQEYVRRLKFKRIVEKYKCAEGVKLEVPNRVLCLETRATMITKDGGRSDVNFILFNDVLMYGWADKIRGEHVLANCGLEEVSNKRSGDYSVGFLSEDCAFIILFKHQQVRHEWMITMGNLIRDQRIACFGTEKAPPSLCTLQYLENRCAICERKLGAIFKRSHLCHVCKKIVCSRCAKTKIRFVDRSSEVDIEKRQVQNSQISAVNRLPLGSNASEGHGTYGHYRRSRSWTKIRHRSVSPTRVDKHMPRMCDLCVKDTREKRSQSNSRKASPERTDANTSTGTTQGIKSREEAKIPKKQLRRLALAQVLLEEEENYVEILLKLVRVAVRPTIIMTSSSEKAGSGEVIFLLDSLSQIAAVSFRFLRDLQERIACWRDDQSLGEIMLQLKPIGDIYESYFNHYAKAMEALDSSTWKSWFKRTRLSLGAPLSNFLTLPRMRLEKYHNFLKQSLVNTSRVQVDYVHVREALHGMEDLMEKLPNVPSWNLCITSSSISSRSFLFMGSGMETKSESCTSEAKIDALLPAMTCARHGGSLTSFGSEEQGSLHSESLSIGRTVNPLIQNQANDDGGKAAKAKPKEKQSP
mmetsp:Transcript_20902/g.29205  ORF Transcript_20902/g.29205 Transcript_20902/m.29205 type:complete len:702 (+) Transcript_20902:129-2234(+)